jgi:hypothetical protein
MGPRRLASSASIQRAGYREYHAARSLGSSGGLSSKRYPVAAITPVPISTARADGELESWDGSCATAGRWTGLIGRRASVATTAASASSGAVRAVSISGSDLNGRPSLRASRHYGWPRPIAVRSDPRPPCEPALRLALSYRGSVGASPPRRKSNGPVGQ